MTEFKDIVYRCPGDHSLPGGSYSYLGVKSEEELEKALSDGWFNTIGEAIDGKAIESEGERCERVVRARKEGEPRAEKVILDLDNAAEDGGDASPTREEMEQQAKELDIRFDGRTSNAKLLGRINEELAK